MQLLARRYRGADGEVDLIMQDGHCLVFVEVKARPSSHAGTGFLAISPKKIARIKRAALTYAVEHGCLESPMRFDAVEITKDGMHHIKNAFQ